MYDQRRAYLLILALAPIFLDVGFLYIVISAWLPTIGFTAFQVGLLVAVSAVFVVVSSIPLGVASDIYGRKLILVLGTLAGSVGLMMYALTTDFSFLLVASAVLGFAEGSTVAVWNALLADLSEPGSRNRVFSLSFVMVNVATGVGLLIPGVFPFVMGPLGLTSFGIHKSVLLILGLLSFISPVAVAAIIWGHKETHNPAKKFAGFKNMRTLAEFGLVGGSIGFGAGFIIPLVGTWFLYRFGAGDAYSGPLLAVSNILIGVSALGAPRMAKRFGQLNAVMITTGSSMFFMLSMAFIPDLNVAAAFYIVRTGLMNMSGPLMDSFSMSIFPPEQRGFVSAVNNTVFRLPNSVSTVFGGYLLSAGLLAYPFIIASGLYVFGLAAFFVFFIASKKYADAMKPQPSTASAT